MSVVLKNLKLYLLAIFIIALLMRVVLLDKIPVSLTIDEVAIAYNSYSILKTAQDEHGVWLPLAFRSIGDYKAPLLVYTMIPAVAMFGLNEFGTRITIALIGAFTPIMVYFLIRKLTSNSVVALLTAFSLAVSPWHIKFSRSTFEAVLALFLIITATWLFLVAVEKKGKYLWLSALFFVLSMFAYHAERVFTPLFVVALFFIYRQKLLQFKKQTIIAFVVGLLVFLPLLWTILSPGGSTRAESTIFLRDFDLKQQLLVVGTSPFPMVGTITIATFWLQRYIEYFDIPFLFFEGMGFTLPNSPDMGLLYWYELPFFLVGLWFFIFQQKKIDKSVYLLMIVWFFLGPLAASLANNAQHPLRLLTWIPMPQVMVGFGLWWFFRSLSSKIKLICLSLLAAIVLYCWAYFIGLYTISYQMLFSEFAMDGWKDAATYAIEHQSQYDEIVIDPRFGVLGPETVGTPYLYIMYYGKISPEMYQNDPRRKEFETSSNFGKFTFREINWEGGQGSDRDKKRTLFIGSKWILPAEESQVIKKFNLLNGKEILRAVEVK